MFARRRDTQRFLAFLLALILVLSALPASVATGAEPMALANATEVGGTLIGDPAGSFAIYEVSYPGGEAELSIELWYAPGDPVTSKAFGFNVYCWNGDQGQGAPNEDGVLEFSYSSEAATKMCVQVYNYTPGQPVSYGITANGIAEPAARMAAAASAPAPTEDGTEASRPITFIESTTGSSVGNNGGALRYHAFRYAGDQEDVTITMNLAPGDAAGSKAVGFIIYGPYGNAVAKGEPTEKAGERKATFGSSQGGVYLIQVHNYLDGVAADFTLTRAPVPAGEDLYVDMGGNRLRARYSDGPGPTVVWIAGAGQPLETFDTVEPAIAKIAASFSYDRMGLGESDYVGDEHRTTAEKTEELRALLAKCFIKPPYILVAHSLAGQMLHHYAATYPEEVAGAVYIDPSVFGNWMNDAMQADMTAEAYAKARQDEADAIASFPSFLAPPLIADLVSMFDAEGQKALSELPFRSDVPAVFLTSTHLKDDPDAASRKRWVDLHARWAQRLKATHVLTDVSGHFIQMDEPELVIDAVRQILDTVRAK